MGKTTEELFAAGFQDGIYHQVNASGQTTAAERGKPPPADRAQREARIGKQSSYWTGYRQGREERRSGAAR